jgi:hypothetical protein
VVRKLISLISAVSIVFSVVVVVSTPASAADPADVRINAEESRAITLGSNFQAESDESAVFISVPFVFSQAQYANIGSGKTLTFRVALKDMTTGAGAVVARERMLNSSGAVSGSMGGNSLVTNATPGSLTVYAYIDAGLLSGVNYRIDAQVYQDGVLLSSGYSIDPVFGTFKKVGSSIIADGTENYLAFVGVVCLIDSAYSTLQEGDVLELTVEDKGTPYDYIEFARIEGPLFSNSFIDADNDGVEELTLTSAMITSKFVIFVDARTDSLTARTYEPVVSIKKRGTATELAQGCATAPSVAPTTTSSVTGIAATVDLDSATSARCYIATAANPDLPFSSNMVMSGQTTCFFSGLKRGDYVVWYERTSRISSGSADVPGKPSPKSTVTTYAGGNATYPTFTGTEGGTGQGSLTLTNISFVGSDFATENRASDGNGGLLVGSIDAPENEYVIRNLTPSGMRSDFGGSGSVSLVLPPFNLRSASGFGSTISLGWYGSDRDKWVATLPGPAIPSTSYYGGVQPSSTVVIASGEYASGNQTVSLISRLEITSFCASAITGADNRAPSWSGSTIRQIVSAPTAEPLMVIDCAIERGTGFGPYFYSSIPFLVSFDGTEFVLKAKLGEEPTSAEPCSRTIISAANSGASSTNGHAMLASYQVTWAPSSGDCIFMSALPSSLVQSRDVFTVNSSYARTQHEDVLIVGATDEPGFQSYSSGSGWRLIVSGPNTHLLAAEVTGTPPTQSFRYRVARLISGEFGTLEQLPYLNVNGTEEFSGATNFSQIADFSEDVADSFLLSRRDFSSGSTAARANLTTGVLTSYQQMASTMAGDGGSLILGNRDGDLNFYGITSRTTAVLGQWVTTGSFDEALTSLPINQGASNTGVTAPSFGPPPPNPGPQQPAAAAPRFNGPIVDSTKIPARLVVGNQLNLIGTNLADVSKVEVGGLDAKVSTNADGTLKITIPVGLAAGTYDLVLTSSQGKVTIQNAIVIGSGSAGEIRPSTRMVADNTVKVWVFEAYGAGKVQILLNGKEIAWVNAAAADDPKLRDGYLVRTLTLAEGKNVIEVLVDGERVSRRVATGS